MRATQSLHPLIRIASYTRRWCALLLTLGGTGVGLASPPPACAQAPGADTLRLFAEVQRAVQRLGSSEDHLWPGFRPDTIPLRLVLPGRGSLLLSWREPLPADHRPVPSLADAGWVDAVDDGAASTTAVVGGRAVAQVVVSRLALDELVGLAAHEAFHVFQSQSRRAGRRFGMGENSFLVSRYPAFDEENERDLALEGRLLAAALRARRAGERRALMRELLAVREARQRRLSAELMEFEMLAELNEGLAEYVGIRAQERSGLLSGPTQRRPQGADSALAAQLERLILEPTRSIRLRFYQTGAAMARLLDQLAGEPWKARLMEENLTLQEALALAAGYRDPETRLRRQALHRNRDASLDRLAARAVADLRGRREAQRDSILSEPGLLVVISAERLGGAIGLCGIDPQNLLQAGEGVLLHTRWVRPCAGNALRAEFITGVVHDQRAGTMSAVIGPETAVTLTIAGQARDPADGLQLAGAREVRIESARANIEAARADVVRTGRVLRLVLLP